MSLHTFDVWIFPLDSDCFGLDSINEAYSGSGMRPLIFTSEGPKEMSQQIGKVLSDCKTAEHDQSLGFNTYPLPCSSRSVC